MSTDAESNHQRREQYLRTMKWMVELRLKDVATPSYHLSDNDDAVLERRVTDHFVIDESRFKKNASYFSEDLSPEVDFWGFPGGWSDDQKMFSHLMQAKILRPARRRTDATVDFGEGHEDAMTAVNILVEAVRENHNEGDNGVVGIKRKRQDGSDAAASRLRDLRRAANESGSDSDDVDNVEEEAEVDDETLASDAEDSDIVTEEDSESVNDADTSSGDAEYEEEGEFESADDLHQLRAQSKPAGSMARRIGNFLKDVFLPAKVPRKEQRRLLSCGADDTAVAPHSKTTSPAPSLLPTRSKTRPMKPPKRPQKGVSV